MDFFHLEIGCDLDRREYGPPWTYTKRQTRLICRSLLFSSLIATVSGGPALRALPPAKCANTVLGTRRRANAARPCPRRRGRVPALRGSRGRSLSRRARSLAAVGRPGARAPLVGPAAAISLLTSTHFPRPWSPRAVSGVVDVAMGDLSPADTKVHTFGRSFPLCNFIWVFSLLIASVLQFTAKLRTTSDCCCFMPLVSTESKEQILKS